MKNNINKKIVVAGHLCLDITPIFHNEKVDNLNKILIPGKLINMEGVKVNTGGVVSNTGIALKILGADVSLMGKVGKDHFGDLVISIFDKYNLGNSILRAEDSTTSYSIVLSVPGLDRIFLHDPAANNTFGYDDLDFEIIKRADLFHFGYPPLMHKMYANNGLELIRIFKKIKELDVATSLDMAAVDLSSNSATVNWEKIIKNIIPYVDFFAPSMEEICYMIDRNRYNEWIKRANGNDITFNINFDDIKPIAEKLIAWGAKIVIIKCGSLGMLLMTGKEKMIASISGNIISDPKNWTQLEHFEKSYLPKKVLSTTGAGDTSIAAFLLAVTKRYPWLKCLQLATATGASCVETYDALSGLHSFEELLKKIKAGWEKQV